MQLGKKRSIERQSDYFKEEMVFTQEDRENLQLACDMARVALILIIALMMLLAISAAILGINGALSNQLSLGQ